MSGGDATQEGETVGGLAVSRVTAWSVQAVVAGAARYCEADTEEAARTICAPPYSTLARDCRGPLPKVCSGST